tara:strand:+ start:199 stop:360 length:162 start_codon:yes stop_codon:yes gene_type:complete
MDIEEIRDYLRENLTISVITNEETDYYTTYKVVEVSISLEGEKMSSDSFTINE